MAMKITGEVSIIIFLGNLPTSLYLFRQPSLKRDTIPHTIVHKNYSFKSSVMICKMNINIMKMRGWDGREGEGGRG
jgi:hypothetical protein